jgi:hypothetical protein
MRAAFWKNLADRDAVPVQDLQAALPAVGVGGHLEHPPAEAGGPDGVLDLDDGDPPVPGALGGLPEPVEVDMGPVLHRGHD